MDPNFCIDNRDLAGILREEVFEGPRHVVIDLTNRCNTNCIACWTYSPLLASENKPGKAWYKEEIEINAFESMVADLASKGVKRIRFTGGGEPLLYRQFERAVKAVKSHDIWLAITSNGIILDRWVDLLKETRVDEIALSIWAASESSYLAVHPKAKIGEFYRILESIKRLRSGEFSPSLHLLNVINCHNYHEIAKMGDLGRNLGARSVYFTLVDAMPDTQGLLLDSKQKIRALEQIEQLKARFYMFNPEIVWDNLDGFELRLRASDKMQYDEDSVDEIPCYMGWHFARVTAAGDVVPCCRGVDYPMGNIHNSAFNSTWHSEKYNEFRNLSLHEKKSHPYFTKMNCYQMCDNLMHNRQIKQRLDSLSEDQINQLRRFNYGEN